MYRQGDVFIQQHTGPMPTGRPVAPTGERIIIAEGEATGHHHSVAAGDVAEAVITDDGAMFLRFCRDTTLAHQEHGPIALTAGVYRATIQREYTPEEIRNVAD